MSTAKQQIVDFVQEQPEDSSSEEIVRELAFHLMVQRGLEDSKHGRTISNTEMQDRIAKWSN